MRTAKNWGEFVPLSVPFLAGGLYTTVSRRPGRFASLAYPILSFPLPSVYFPCLFYLFFSSTVPPSFPDDQSLTCGQPTCAQSPATCCGGRSCVCRRPILLVALSLAANRRPSQRGQLPCAREKEATRLQTGRHMLEGRARQNGRRGPLKPAENSELVRRVVHRHTLVPLIRRLEKNMKTDGKRKAASLGVPRSNSGGEA